MRAKKTLKRSNDSTVEITEPKKHGWFDYRNIYGLLAPMDEKGIGRIAEELVNWASHEDDAFKISQFYLSKGISEGTWREWVIKFDCLREAQNTAKLYIGNRREIGAIKNKLNTSVVAFTMPFYDEEWKDETIRRAALKEGSSGDGKDSITVVLNPIPNSEIVLQRNTKDEEQK